MQKYQIYYPHYYYYSPVTNSSNHASHATIIKKKKKKLTHFVWFRRKSDPSLPNAMSIQVVLSEAFPEPQIDW